MKRATFSFVAAFMVTTNISALKYHIEEYSDNGPVQLTFTHKNKFTNEAETYTLRSIVEEDISQLVEIRKHPYVCAHYASHNNPDQEEVKGWLTNKLLPRTNSSNSFFPFVLKKSYQVMGLYNIGVGFAEDDRQFGIYINPDQRLEKDDAIHRGRPAEFEEHYENLGTGLGSKAMKVATHFVMSFHEKAPGLLYVNGNPIQHNRQKFSGVLSATADPDNTRGKALISKVGMKKLPPDEVESLGYKNHLKYNLPQESGGTEVIKDYWTLTWNDYVLAPQR